MLFCVSVIFLVTLGLSASFRVAENVVFEKTQEISVVRSKWVFSFVTDITAYHVYMERLKVTLGQMETTMNQARRGYSERGEPYYARLYDGQRKEISALKVMYARAMEDLRDVLMIQQSPVTPRIRRALIPVLGKVLSFLTGTLTKHDIRKVYQHMNTLADNQEQIIHVLNDSLSILNVTNVEVKKNRHQVIAVTEMLRSLDRRLINVTAKMKRYISNLSYFLSTYLQMDLMIAELRESIQSGMFYMENMKMELDQLALGHLAPTVIHPNELKRILVEINAQIPNYLTLPAPQEDIWYYYKTLTCVTLIKGNRFVTLVNLPLLELNSLFEVYQIHNIPLPYLDTRMTATYELETVTLAVNVKRTQYILLTETDLAKCSNPTVKFCNLHSAVYNFGETELCVIALFKRDKGAVSEYCQTVVHTTTMLPQAVYIPDGNWIVVAIEPLLFTVMCLKESAYQVQTKPPIYNLQIGPACEAYSDTITLPPFYHKESQYDLLTQKDGLLILQNTSALTLWEPMDIFDENDMSTLADLPELDEIQDVPIDTLIAKLNNLQRPDPARPQNLWVRVWEYLEYVLIFLVVLAIIILIMWLKCFRGKLNLNLCMRAMGNREITKEADTDQTAGPKDVENVKSADIASNQPREVTRCKETAPSSGTLVLELASSGLPK